MIAVFVGLGGHVPDAVSAVFGVIGAVVFKLMS